MSINYNTEEAIDKLRKMQEQLTDQYQFEMAVLEEKIINLTLKGNNNE